MDSKSLSEQEKDIRDLLRRAERTPVKTSALRRDTLKRLIDLAHSPHTSLKIVAASNLKLFIKDFPELEDDAINAVYDLCEDPVTNVRIKGYSAIIDVSREQNKWVKRNADVLVQLLQSDEPEEVTFVKRALTQHLDMDPTVTLGVICDQITPADGPLDDEEKAIRDRLRSLVISFLATEAKRPLVERHAATYGSPPEQVLVSGLFKAITRLSPSDVDIIVKDILAALPSFKPSSDRGKELLDVLLTQVRAILKAELSSNGTPKLGHARYYLDLACFIIFDKRMVHPSHLLRFLYTSLTPKSVIGRLPEAEQAYVINTAARTFTACEEMGTRGPPKAPAADLGKTPGSGSEAAEDVALRKQFPDISAVLLHVFADMKVEEQRPWSACHVIVQAIARRKQDQRWNIPNHITSALRRVESVPPLQEASPEAIAAQEQACSVIRQSLLEPINPPVQKAATTSPSKESPSTEQKGNVNKVTGNGTHGTSGMGASTSSDDLRRVITVHKRKLDHADEPSTTTTHTTPSSSIVRPASLPPRPSPATVASSFANAQDSPRADRQRERQAPPHLKGKITSSIADTGGLSSTEAGGKAGSVLVDGDTSLNHSAKRQKLGDNGRKGRGGQGIRSESVSSGGQNGGTDTTAPQTPGATTADTHASSQTKVKETKPIPSLLSRLAGGKASPTSTTAATERDQPTRDRDRDRSGRSGRIHESNVDKARVDSDLVATQSVVPLKRQAEPFAQPHSSRSAPSSTTQSSYTLSRPSRQAQRSAEPTVGFSIRGAAKAATAGSSDGLGARVSGSLLERLQIPTQDNSGSYDGGRRKKRTKQS